MEWRVVVLRENLGVISWRVIFVLLGGCWIYRRGIRSPILLSYCRSDVFHWQSDEWETIRINYICTWKLFSRQIFSHVQRTWSNETMCQSNSKETFLFTFSSRYIMNINSYCVIIIYAFQKVLYEKLCCYFFRYIYEAFGTFLGQYIFL